jgi:hypothetical protein
MLQHLSALRHVPVRLRCLHPASSTAASGLLPVPPGPAGKTFSGPSCLASSTQQVNSFRAKSVVSSQASSAATLAITALPRSAGSLCNTPPGTRCLLTGLRQRARELTRSMPPTVRVGSGWPGAGRSSDRRGRSCQAGEDCPVGVGILTGRAGGLGENARRAAGLAQRPSTCRGWPGAQMWQFCGVVP